MLSWGKLCLHVDRAQSALVSTYAQYDLLPTVKSKCILNRPTQIPTWILGLVKNGKEKERKSYAILVPSWPWPPWPCRRYTSNTAKGCGMDTVSRPACIWTCAHAGRRSLETEKLTLRLRHETKAKRIDRDSLVSLLLHLHLQTTLPTDLKRYVQHRLPMP